MGMTKDRRVQGCGAEQDNTTGCGTSEERTGRSVGNTMYAVGGGESGYIAPDPKNANNFYAGSQGALLTKYDRSTGHIRDIQVYPLFFSGMPAIPLKDPCQWTFPIRFSPTHSNSPHPS